MIKKYLIFSAVIFALFLNVPAFAGTIEGAVVKIGPKNAGKVLVYIDKVPGAFPTPTKHKAMNQKDLVFIPFLLPILQGTTVDFLNSDNVRHNVFSPDGEKFNLGTWEQGKVKSYTFNKLGVYSILCNVHPEMEAYVISLQNPYFAKVGKDGTFKIQGIKDGIYTLKTWHPKKKFPDVGVTVKGGKAAPVTIQ